MQDAIVIGAGIAGLTAARQLQKRGLDVAVLERASRPGGPILSCREDGYLVEKGPNSLLLPDPWADAFIQELGLSDQRLETRPEAKRRYIVRDGRPVPVPASPWQAAATPLFSLRAKLGFLGEPFRSPLGDADDPDESVAAFVRRRLGPEFLDYAIDPFVSGIYAGDPEELVLRHAFPLMRELEREGGSLVRGALARKRRLKRAGQAYKKRSISFRDGLEALPKRLAATLGNRLWLGSEVVRIERAGVAWRVAWTQGDEPFEAATRFLLVCVPAYAVKALPWPEPLRSALRNAPDLPYPTVHSLALGFRRSQVAHPLDGFGILAPSKERRTILGALFSSSLYPGRAPKGRCLLTVMLGGRRKPELAAAEEPALRALSLADLSDLLGIEGEPEFSSLATWPRAIPQYTAAFGPWSETLRSLQEALPGLRFGGHAIDGISLGACLLGGKRVAEAVPDPA